MVSPDVIQTTGTRINMQLALHAGAHFTENDRLLRCLLRNKDSFARRGVAVPGPGKYKTLLRSTILAIQDHPPAPDAGEVLLDMILEEEDADRVILSHMFLFGAPRACVRDGLIYDIAPERLAQIASLFADNEIELFVAIRNPATFLPALMQASPQENMAEFLRGSDPYTIRWSETFQKIRAAAPTIKITTWCFEDMPILWAQIIREMAGFKCDEKIIGSFDLLSEIMRKEGMQRFQNYIRSHPDITERQMRRVIGAFLDKYAMEDQIEEELDAPGWNEEIIDNMTDIYEQDIATIARISGVTFIAP